MGLHSGVARLKARTKTNETLLHRKNVCKLLNTLLLMPKRMND
jgi:hypothetical protein